MPDKREFREYYASLPEDQFQMVALRPDLLPEAREAVTEELEARGLTAADLKAFRRQMRRDAALAKRSEYVARQRQSDFDLALHTGVMVLIAWISAFGLPLVLATGRAPRNTEVLLFPAGFIAASCFLGIRARRKGESTKFVLMTLVPLVLLGITSIVAVVMALS